MTTFTNEEILQNNLFHQLKYIDQFVLLFVMYDRTVLKVNNVFLLSFFKLFIVCIEVDYPN